MVALRDVATGRLQSNNKIKRTKGTICIRLQLSVSAKMRLTTALILVARIGVSAKSIGGRVVDTRALHRKSYDGHTQVKLNCRLNIFRRTLSI